MNDRLLLPRLYIMLHPLEIVGMLMRYVCEESVRDFKFQLSSVRVPESLEKRKTILRFAGEQAQQQQAPQQQAPQRQAPQQQAARCCCRLQDLLAGRRRCPHALHCC